MATPSPKSKEINQFINSAFGINRVNTIRGNKCVVCGKDATEFKDALSAKEYRISGMCQKCQDKTFDTSK